MVQKSIDGTNFSDLTFVTSKGATANQYFTVDYSPANGLNYYRLIQQDSDGKQTNLGDRVVNYTLAYTEVKAWPIPVYDILNVSFTTGKYSSLNVFDVSGKKLLQLNLTSQQGLATVNVGDYRKGVYVIELKGEATNHKVKFVK